MNGGHRQKYGYIIFQHSEILIVASFSNKLFQAPIADLTASNLTHSIFRYTIKYIILLLCNLPRHDRNDLQKHTSTTCISVFSLQHNPEKPIKMYVSGHSYTVININFKIK